MKVVFFGTSNVALPILEVLHKHHEVLAVVTMPDAKVGRNSELMESPVSVLAKEMGLKILKPEKVKDNYELYQTLQNLSADLFVVVSFGHILPLDIIKLPQFKTINVHFSLLPKYRGPSPIQFALINGDSQTGTSIFILDEKIDHGQILAQEKTTIDRDDNFVSLSQKLAKLSAELLIKILPDYIAGRIESKEQDEAGASFTKIISREDGKIDWTKSANEIYNRFRAFYPWPGIWTTWNGKILKVLDCSPTQDQSNTASPGTVLLGGVVVCGGNSFLQIKILQMEGKNETNISDFLNGYREFVGVSLV